MTSTPADMVCFALYSATHAIQQAYRPLLDDLRLTYPQYLVLSVLWSAGAPLTVGGIGKDLYLESSTLTPLLKRLEKLGLVTRKRDPEDERQVRVGLTAQGRALKSRAAQVSECITARTGMTADDLDKLRTDLAALSRHLRSAP